MAQEFLIQVHKDSYKLDFINMDLPKVTVIIPIYCVEKYIERCARSLFDQTLEEIEYIFVNDCTPDRSVEILHSIMHEYPHRAPYVRIINHETNKGLTKTRNTGLSVATGEYIAHCDSDDWVDCDMYRRLYNHAVKTKSDIVYSDIHIAYKSKTEYYNSANYDPDKSKLLQNYISSVWTSLVNMIVKRSIYENNNLRSPEHISYCEDFWLSVRLLHFAKKISKVSKAFYYYNQENGMSIMHNLQNHRGDDMKCYLETIEFFREEGVLEKYQQEISWRVLNAFHFDMYVPQKHKHILSIFPICHKYILSCPFYIKRQKQLMWLLSHHCRWVVLLFIFFRNLLRREAL